MGLRLPLRTSSRAAGDPWVDPLRDGAHLPRHCVDHMPWREAVLRPFVLLADDTAAHRAEATRLQPETVRNHVRRLLRALGVHSRLEAVALARRAQPAAS